MPIIARPAGEFLCYVEFFLALLNILSLILGFLYFAYHGLGVTIAFTIYTILDTSLAITKVYYNET